jgi:hypothetical protein
MTNRAENVADLDIQDTSFLASPGITGADLKGLAQASRLHSGDAAACAAGRVTADHYFVGEIYQASPPLRLLGPNRAGTFAAIVYSAHDAYTFGALLLLIADEVAITQLARRKRT